MEENRYNSVTPQFLEAAKKSVVGSQLPTEAYQSTVGFYGATLNTDGDALVWTTEGIMPWVDRTGDALLRRLDDHMLSSETAGKLVAKGKFKELFYFLITSDPKRHRGTAEAVAKHAAELGLQDVYKLHGKGIEISDRELFTKGIALQDIWRSNEIGADVLTKIDRFQALKEASEYLRKVHEESGVGVGEVLPSDFIFRKTEFDESTEENRVSEPVLNIPDIVFRADNSVPATEQQAIDLIDMLFSFVIEEFDRNQEINLISAEKVIGTILLSYKDPTVIAAAASLLKRGRLTLPDMSNDSVLAGALNKFGQIHNKARLRVPENLSQELRKIIISYCDSFKFTPLKSG